MPQVQSPVPSKDALQRLIDGVQTLIREHMALARAEIKEDLRGMGRDVVMGASGVPALAAGYLILMIAIGFLLALWLPNWAAFGIVALVNLAAGGALTYTGVRKAMSNRVDLQRTAEELQLDRQWLSTMKNGSRSDANGELGTRSNAALPTQQPISH